MILRSSISLENNAIGACSSSNASDMNSMNGSADNDGCSDVPFSLDISNLSLEYSGGLQIELQIYGGKCKDNCNKGIKLRRISGDQFEYGKLCQQLISSLTV